MAVFSANINAYAYYNKTILKRILKVPLLYLKILTVLNVLLN